jgi:hypothetical protein
VETGVNSFTTPGEIGALYPFVGTEVLLVILGVLLWLVWHLLDIRGEGKEFEEAARLYREVGLERAMHNNGSGKIFSEEEIAVDKVYKLLHKENQHKILDNGGPKAASDKSLGEETGREESREN